MTYFLKQISLSIMRIFILIAILSLLSSISYGQVQLQITKIGKKKTINFQEGDEVIIKLKQEDSYRTVVIKKLYAEANLMLTDMGTIALDDIVKIKTIKKQLLGKILFYKLGIFGIAWGFFSLAAFLFFGEPLTWSILIVMGVSFLLGWMFKRIFKHKIHKLGKGRKKKLRIIDFRPQT